MYIYKEPGDRFFYGQALVLGNFNRMKDAKECASQTAGAKVEGYLHGKYKRGWIAYVIDRPMSQEDAERMKAEQEAAREGEARTRLQRVFNPQIPTT